MSLCTPLTHAEAASLPMLVLPPVRLRVLNPAQALQLVLTLRFCRPGRLPRVDQVVALFPEGVRLALHNLLTTLLARRIAAGPAADAAALCRAMEAAWTQPLVLRRWQRVALRRTAEQCERIVDAAVQQKLAGAKLRCLSLETATDGWALETGGPVNAAAGEGALARWRIGPSPAVRAVTPPRLAQASQATHAY